MSEWRQDPVTGRWVIVASERLNRPKEFSYSKGQKKDKYLGDIDNCPFCPGHEHYTPEEILRIPKRGDWELRVIPNKYPALTSKPKEVVLGEHRDLFKRLPGWGHHEVIVETREHWSGPEQMSNEQLRKLLLLYLERYQALSQRPGIQYVSIFHNDQSEAGASLLHPHSQIIAMNQRPPVIMAEIDGYNRYLRKTGRCVYCDVLGAEQESERLIYEGEHFSVFAPFASFIPYEMWIVPHSHKERFDLSFEETEDLANVLGKTLSMMAKVLDSPPYNYFIHTSPRDEDDFHWHMEIYPRLGAAAGFELSTGININVISPEMVARLIKRHCLE